MAPTVLQRENRQPGARADWFHAALPEEHIENGFVRRTITPRGFSVEGVEVQLVGFRHADPASVTIKAAPRWTNPGAYFRPPGEARRGPFTFPTALNFVGRVCP